MTTLSEKPPIYYSYILRCWVEPYLTDESAPHCRYSLEDPHTGERLLFVSLEQLSDFLQARAIDCCAAIESNDEIIKRKT